MIYELVERPANWSHIIRWRSAQTMVWLCLPNCRMYEQWRICDTKPYSEFVPL